MKEKYFELRKKGFRASVALQVAKYTKYPIPGRRDNVAIS